MFNCCFGMHLISGSREPKTGHALRDFQKYLSSHLLQNIIFVVALLIHVHALELPQLNQSWFLLACVLFASKKHREIKKHREKWRSALARTWHYQRIRLMATVVLETTHDSVPGKPIMRCVFIDAQNKPNETPFRNVGHVVSRKKMGSVFFCGTVIGRWSLQVASSGYDSPGVQIKDLAVLAVPQDDHLWAFDQTNLTVIWDGKPRITTSDFNNYLLI